jgi:hypothetical protein
MTIELGAGLLAVLASLITTTGGIVFMLIKQHYEFRRAEIERMAASNRASNSADKAVAAAEDTKSALGDIHGLVNSRLTEALEQIKAMKEEIAKLKERQIGHN